ncbi:WXG100 family type VII secretion target [Paenibacillus sp. 1781tsa1]|nr:WXG100 family type VII secretion target [Paenibacillus sp. 1781tsa1]
MIRWMESMWSGMVRERFLERFEETQPRMIETLEHLTHIAKELRDIGVRFQQADEMSGAAVAGTVATMSIGLKAANSPSDKGYRMAYNSQWHMWLPVNEKGVTDQTALQAYEKDKGKLDNSSLSQGMGAVEPPNQDLIQLQIEALELRVNPFTGEPVTDDYAKMMISSLKWSQIVAGIGLVTGSLSGGKGPYKGRGTNPAIAKVKQTIKDAKAKREQSSKSSGGTVKGTYSGGRNQTELDDLARDPASSGKIEPKNIREREVGLAVEERGELGRLIRDPQRENGAEFIDTSSGLKWDVKSFESFPSGNNGIPITNPKKGAFTVQQGMKKLQKEFDNGNNVIIDTRKMEGEHIKQMKKAIDEAGVADKIIWYP